MSVLEYRLNELMMEQTSLRDIADQFGTPTFVYSRAAITANYQAYADALGDHPGTVCYAVKANSNLGVLNVLARLGAGFDIVSVGELERVLRAGGDPSKIVFSGVGKKAEEMARALEVGVACFNVESRNELDVLSQVANSMGKVANISLRVNPDVDANTHPYISTGLKENKFGIDIDQAEDVYRYASGLPSVHIKGVDCHIGSQLTSLAPFLDALERVLALVERLTEHGITIHHLDLGGGLGVTYHNETPPPVAEYVNAIKKRLKGSSLSLMFEPGRSIVANAGVLLTRVLYLKPTAHKNFAIIDAAMNDNIRPALYQAWQELVSVQPHDGPRESWDFVGPVCETGDFLAKQRTMSLKEGDLLAMKSSGAYCFSMSSNYNTRGRAAEVLVDGAEIHIVRRRETVNDMLALESMLPDKD